MSFSGQRGREAGAAASSAGNLSEDEETKIGVGDFHRKSSGEASKDDQPFPLCMGIERT